MRFRWPILCLALAASLWVFPAQALKYRIQDLGTIQGGVNESILPLAVNNLGTVVGNSIYDPGATRQGSFIYENGSIRPLRATGHWYDAYSATDVNDQGVAVGTYYDRRTKLYRTVMYRDGAVIDVGRAAGGSRNPPFVHINNAGTVVGRDDAGSFIYDGTVSRELKIDVLGEPFSVLALNDRGVMAGWSRRAGYFLYDGTTVSPLPRVSERPTTFTVVDLNNENQLLASATIQGSDGQIRSGYVIYDDGRYRPLNPSGSIRGALTARAFNDQGAVVGLKFVGPNRDRAHAVVWRDGTTRDLNDFMAPDPSGATWELIDAWDINERGQIVGIGRLGDVTNARGFIATPVPEPGGWALLLAGLGVLGWKARRAGPARS